ncbi:conserved hypothetical protein [uncultured Defluviicoccus sp.]|uniref:DUF2333 domain-containing protein n=1 Tax=metagenome TaxID=256318 RepID=A0A380TEP2_9ZZZZ|nr:conserved hypothetical protein [uncultured Defluviicoccus sp.]
MLGGRKLFGGLGAGGEGSAGGGWPLWSKIAAVVAVMLLLGYPIAMLMAHQINDDPDFTPGPEFEVEGGSRAVAMAAALIHREVVETKWVANTPFPFPSSFLDNMPNFQGGLMYALSRFAVEMTDSLGRARGTSQVDHDLDHASGLLKYDGTIWVWEPSISIFPTARAETQYQAGMRALMNYNKRLAAGEAVFEKRADNLISLLERVAADLGGVSAAIDARLQDAGAGWFDTQADDVFYANKGRLYGYALLLRALGQDFESMLADRNVGTVWEHMIASMVEAASLRPLIVSNGSPDGLIFPNHLAAQGFLLLRGRIQLREVANILAK